MPPNAPEKDKRFLRILFCAACSLFFLGAGTLAAGLLFREENVARAIFLFVAALLGALGSLFFFILCLRALSPKPKDPFIPTLP
jgi:hypothetical protein